MQTQELFFITRARDEQRYPASITKIMTLLVAVENSTMDEKVTFTETGVRNVTADSSNIGTKVGESPDYGGLSVML